MNRMNNIKVIVMLIISIAIPTLAQFNYWVPLSPIPADYIETMLIDDTGVIYVGTFFDDNFYRSTDQGNSWISSNVNCSIFTEDITQDLDGNVFFADNGCISRTFDNGSNWEIVKYTFQGRTVFINSLSYIFSGEEQDWNVGRLYRSKDNGNNWEYYDFPHYAVVYSMGSDSYNNLYAGTTHGVYTSSNNGDSWGNNQLENEWIPCLEINENNVIVVGTWDNGIFRSTDLGSSWVETSLHTPEIRDFTLDNNGYLWAATNSGVFRSTNDGKDWIPFNSSGLSNINIKSITVDPGGFIVVGVDSGKVFKTRQSTTSVKYETSPTRFHLSQNFPNPFNPSTKIKFTIPDLRFATLKIYDVLGNEVATLVNEEKPAGQYEVEFDGTGLPSGIYFYQLRAGSFVEMKKMLLLK